jgi:hypothetical protein
MPGLELVPNTTVPAGADGVRFGEPAPRATPQPA